MWIRPKSTIQDKKKGNPMSQSEQIGLKNQGINAELVHFGEISNLKGEI